MHWFCDQRADERGVREAILEVPEKEWKAYAEPEPGIDVSKAEWIEVKAVQNPAGLYSAQRKYGLGPGEMSTILLAKELGANPVLLDDYRARKLAKVEGLEILGTVGLLEAFYLRRYLTDLRSAFQQLLMHNVYIDQRLLDRRLRALGLPAL